MGGTIVPRPRCERGQPSPYVGWRILARYRAVSPYAPCPRMRRINVALELCRLEPVKTMVKNVRLENARSRGPNSDRVWTESQVSIASTLYLTDCISNLLTFHFLTHVHIRFLKLLRRPRVAPLRIARNGQEYFTTGKLANLCSHFPVIKSSCRFRGMGE